MRTFDWFISGTVALLYCDVANEYEAERGIAERFDPDRDFSWFVVYFVDGEPFVNWPFVFAVIATVCFLVAFWKIIVEQRKK